MKFRELTDRIMEGYRDEYYQNVILTDSHKAFKYAQNLLNKAIPIPNEILQIVSKNKFYSTGLSQNFLDYKLPVPELLLKSVSQDRGKSIHLAQKYIFKKLPVPELLIQAALQIKNEQDLRTVYHLVRTYVEYNQPVPEPLKPYLERRPFKAKS